MLYLGESLNDDFTIEKYLKPNASDKKYIGRDKEVSKFESDRRMAIMPKIIDVSNYYCKENNIKPPTLLVTGSTAVNMAVEKSDLDIAVLVDNCHDFDFYHQKWVNYSKMLSQSVVTDFEINPLLIIGKINIIEVQKALSGLKNSI